MCGIAGIWGKGDIAPMVRTLAHRGPDDEGFYEDSIKPIQLGMRRLAVIDIEGGAQPMSNEDGSIILVFNGMIFNYRELRSELENRRHTFRTKTDTETIIHAYEEYGDDFPRHLNGMFALALWDGKKLILARDRLGEKPLYWYHDKDKFIFASEIKSILTQIDAEPVFPDLYFSLESTVGDETMFRGVHTMLPGTILVFDGKRTEQKRYWKIDPAPPDPDKPDSYYIDRLRELVEDSVRIRMRSDVNVGLFLSGGLDSAIIAALARPETVLTCNFPAGAAYDELEYAKASAESIGAELHIITPGPDDLKKRLGDILKYLDQPVATPSSIAEFMLAEAASRTGVKVVLGGQGADEAFGGYTRYLFMKIEEELGSLPQLANYKPMARHFWGPDVFGEPAKRYAGMLHRGSGPVPDILVELVRKKFSRGLNLTDSMGLVDIDLTLPSLLTMNDRAAASVGLENRCPFLDYRIVEFAFTIPERLKIRNHTGKYILRRIAEGIVPQKIIERTDKKGLVVPVASWIDNELSEWSQKKISRMGEFRTRFGRNKTTRGEFDRSAYHALSTALWLEKFIPGMLLPEKN